MEYYQTNPISSSGHDNGTPSPFCDTCRHNQLLVMQLIASYDGLEEDMDKYRSQIEDMYPLVCKECLPRVDQTLKDNDYKAKARILGSWLDGGGSSRPITTTSPSAIRVFLWYIRGISWWTCAIGCIIWYLLGCLKDSQQLFVSAVLDQTKTFEYHYVVRTLYLAVSLVLQLDNNNNDNAKKSLAFNASCLLIQLLRFLIPWSFLFSLWDYRWRQATIINSHRRVVRRVKGRAEYAIIQLINYLVRLSSIQVIPYICRQAAQENRPDEYYNTTLLRTCCLIYLVVSVVGVASALRSLHLDIIRLPNMSTVPSVSLEFEQVGNTYNNDMNNDELYKNMDASQPQVYEEEQIYVQEIQMQDAPDEPSTKPMQRQRFFPPPSHQHPEDAKLEHLFTSALDLGNPTSSTFAPSNHSTAGPFTRLISKVKSKLQ